MSEMSTPPENSTFSHSWTITDFSQKLESSVEHPCITSLSFPSTSPNTKSPVFRLSLYLKGINASFSDYLSIGFGAVSLIDKNDEKITVRYRVSLIDSKGERCFTKEWLYIFSSSKRVSAFGRFIARSELFCPSNGLLTDDKLVIHCEGTVLGEPTALDYANTNLDDLKFVATSQPDLMVDMLFSLATKHRLTYYSPEGVPNFEIQNQVEETFSYSYKAKMYDYEIFTWTQSKYMKSTEELKLLSRQEMLDLFNFWMVSGKYSDLFLVLQGDHEEKEMLNLHKIVLLNRSSAFDVLLLQNSCGSRVSIDDMLIKVFAKLIHYLYTGKVPLLKEYQYELLDVSREYGFDLLNQMSQLSICDELTTENVFYMLIEASEASVELLKRACLEYITDHATELMFDLPDFLKPELIEEMYCNLGSKHRQAESDRAYVHKVIPNFAIQTQVDETFSYTALYNNFMSFSSWSNSKYSPRSTQELIQISRRLMLDTLSYWMNSGTRVNLSLVIGLGDKEELWQLHSIVLFNRSSAFDALLNSNTDIEEQNSRVSIGDAPIDAFDQMIQYLYTGKALISKEYQYELLTISCEYGFDVLKQMCELTICGQITAENAIYMLTLASEVASLDRLKRVALLYITDHAVEVMLDLPDSLKPELIGELYRNLALKNVLNESEDRQVYEHFQPSIVSDVTEEDLSCTHHKMHRLSNEFIFQDYLDYSPYFCLFEGEEFGASENSSLKFKVVKSQPINTAITHPNYDLLVKDDDTRHFELSQPQVSFIRYKMSLCLWQGNGYYQTLGTCDGVEYLKVSSFYTRLCNSICIPIQKLDYCYLNRSYLSRIGTFKIRSDIILPLVLSPIQWLTQLEVEQSRKQLLECINSLLHNDKRNCDVTLVVSETEFKVHSIFLAQSQLLSTMLVQFKRISISDLSIEAFVPFVQYLYTGKVQSLDKYAEELLIVASRYKLEILTQMCNYSLNRPDDKDQVKEDDDQIDDDIREYVERATAILNSVNSF